MTEYGRFDGVDPEVALEVGTDGERRRASSIVGSSGDGPRGHAEVERDIEVSVKLQPEVAEAVDRPEARTPEASAVLGVIEELGVPLQPVHPHHADPGLRTYYRVEVPDEEAAEQVRKALSGLEGVEAAYVQPPDALP